MKILNLILDFALMTSIGVFIILICKAFWHGYKIRIGSEDHGFYWSISQKPLKRFFSKNKIE